MFDWEHGTPQHAMQRNRASSYGEGKSHMFSRVVAGTWGIYSCYGGKGHLKLAFVQQSEDSCLVMMDSSGS